MPDERSFFFARLRAEHFRASRWQTGRVLDRQTLIRPARIDDDDEIIEETPDYLARVNIFVPARDLVTA